MPHRPARTARLLVAATATTLSLPLASARATNISWSTPTSGLWSDPTKWTPAAVPTTSDSVTINSPGSYTVTVDDFAVAGPVTLNATGATLSITNASGWNDFFSTPTASFTISAGTLAVRSNGTTATRVTSTSFANAGTVNLYVDAVSTPSAVVSISTRSGPVVNSGTIEAHEAPTPTLTAVYTFAGSTPPNTFTNTGTLRTVGASKLYLTNYTFNQNAGTLDGDIELSGGTFNYNGGTCTPAHPVSLSNATLNIAPTATDGNLFLYTGASLKGDIPAGNTISTSSKAYVTWNATAGSTVTNAGHLAIGYYAYGQYASANAPSLQLPSPSTTLLNTGTLEINNPAQPVASFSGSISNQGSFAVNPANTTATTNLTGSFTNAGSASIASNTALFPGYNFTHNGGSLTIAPAASLSLTNAHFYYNAGSVAGNVSLDNSTVHFAPSLSSAGGTFTATTTTTTPFAGDIPAGAAVSLIVSPGLYTTSLPSFTNAGTFATSLTGTASGRTTYRLVNGTGTLTNTGTLTGTNPPGSPTNSGPSAADRGFYAQIDGSLTNTGDIKARYLTLHLGTFNQNAGTIDVDTYCNVWQGTFNYNGGTLTGKPVGINDSTLNIAPNTNPASFTFYLRANTLHGSPSPGSTLALEPLSSSPATVTVTADPFTNPGTLSFAATLAACTSTLTIPNSGTLTNTGTLSVTLGKGGTRTLNATVLNSGTFSIGPGATLTLNGSLTTSTPLDLQGTLDLKTGGPLLWSYTDTSPADTIRSLLADSHLTSSAADPTHRLAYLDTGSAVTVSLTLPGDANCDGKLDPDDYALLDRAFALSLTSAHWTDGDFNYDGAVDAADYLLIDTTLAQTQGLSPALLSLRESQFGPDYVSALLTSIPEPSSFACLFAALLPHARRRRVHHS